MPISLGKSMYKFFVGALVAGVCFSSFAGGYAQADLMSEKMTGGCEFGAECSRKLRSGALRFGSEVARGGMFDFGDVYLGAVEVSYVKYGAVQSSGLGPERLVYNGGSTNPSNANVRVRDVLGNRITADALQLAAVFKMDFLSDLRGLLKIGGAYMSTRSAYQANGGGNGAIVENHFQPYFGVGAEYSVVSSVSVVSMIDVTRYKYGRASGDAGSGQIRGISFGVKWLFD